MRKKTNRCLASRARSGGRGLGGKGWWPRGAGVGPHESREGTATGRAEHAAPEELPGAADGASFSLVKSHEGVVGASEERRGARGFPCEGVGGPCARCEEAAPWGGERGRAKSLRDGRVPARSRPHTR